jgi:precorrin-8X/cobalt-precorrin-8 methylmutase
MWRQMQPGEIERMSMEIIDREMGTSTYPVECLPVVRRVIHTTADFDFASTMFFSPGVVEIARESLKQGANVITDTSMVAAGINKSKLARHHSQVFCYIGDPDVATEAASRSATRAVVSMEKAVREMPDAVFVIGNAPTALLRLCQLIQQGKAKPSLVIGVPVGFVNVVESKEALLRLPVPRIVAQGRKGGSAVAAAIVNALLYGMDTDNE